MVSCRRPRNAVTGRELLRKQLAFMKFTSQVCSRYRTAMLQDERVGLRPTLWLPSRKAGLRP